MKQINKIISIIFLFITLVTCILAHAGVIKNIDVVLIIVAGITALTFLVFHCFTNWKRSILIALLAFCVIIGAGKLMMITGNVGAYIFAQTNNSIQGYTIMHSDKYRKVMSYQDIDYYVDENFEYLYCIEQKGLIVNVQANAIMIGSEAEHVFKDLLSDFYLIDDNPAFSDKTDISVSIGFPTQIKDANVFIKLIDKDNKVYYSYLLSSNIKQFVRDLNIVYDEIQINNLSLWVTKANKIIDGTDDSEEIKYKEGHRYIITATSSLFTSELFTIEFKDKTTYYERVNTYIFRDYIASIEEYEQELNKMDPNSDDYKTLKAEIDALRNSMSGVTTELCYEFVQGDQTIRFYRAFNPSETITEVPDINIVEIEKSGQYTFATTQLSIEEFK